MGWIRPPRCLKCGGPSTRESPCKPCRNAYLRERYAAKPHLQAEAKKRYVAAHPIRVAEQRAAYKQKPKVKMAGRLRANLSRAWKGGYGQGVMEVTEFDLQRMADRQHGMCAVCARTDRPLTIDHIVPVSSGGTNALGNLQLLCRPCNTGKMTKTFSGIGYLLSLQGLTLTKQRSIPGPRSRSSSRKRHDSEPKNLALKD